MSASSPHGGRVDSAELFDQPLSIYRPNLVENDSRGDQEAALGRQHHFAWMGRIIEAGTDGSHNGDRAVLI